MNMNGKILLFLALLLFASITVYADEEQEQETEELPAVVKIKNIFSYKLTMGYNFMYFEDTSNKNWFQTNRPWDFGIGLGIGNINIGFTFSLPFLYNKAYARSQSFDINFNHYSKKNNLTSGYVKYYNRFHNHTDGDIDLRILNLGFSYEHIFNKNHSLRSAYNLDVKQTVSNGSFIVGGGLFFTTIRANSEFLPYYDERKITFYFGPDAGYSYTWVINGFFINVMSVVGINGVVSNREFSFGVQALPRLSFGYHGKKISTNIYATSSFLASGFTTKNMEYKLLSANIGIAFIRRFL